MASQPVKWTIMAYINADNILANFAVESLKQLRNAASENVVVIAEFDDNQQGDARLYRFDGNPEKRNAPLEKSLIPQREIAHLKHIHNANMTAPETLTEFIDFATENSRTQRYCLILWGHGIELLLDEDRRFGTDGETAANCLPAADIRPASKEELAAESGPENGDQPVRYLTPANLAEALAKTRLAKGSLARNHPKNIAANHHGSKQKSRCSLDILGLDACSMSMIEVASAVREHVDFLIASQEDVPDVSFPYQKILADLQAEDVRGDVKKVCRLIPRLYENAFRDYIATPGTGVKGITLTSLSLREIHSVTEPLHALSNALLQASHDPVKRRLILSARRKTKNFVFGLLVDWSDFCVCLQEAFGKKETSLQSACNSIRAALELRDQGFVLANQVSNYDERCHGLSIYLPYRREADETDNTEERLSKGTNNRPLKGTNNRPLKERTARIRELERDFSHLEAFQRTGWMRFIQSGWSLTLANEVPFEIDYYYSAEQCAANLVSSGTQSKAKAA